MNSKVVFEVRWFSLFSNLFTTNLLLSLLAKQFLKYVNILTKLQARRLIVSHAFGLCASGRCPAKNEFATEFTYDM